MMALLHHDSADNAVQTLPGRPAASPGSMPTTGPAALPVGKPPGRSRRKSPSPFNILLFLLGLAVAIVLYVSNVIAVNQLLHDVNALENEHRQILMEQERLRAQLHRLASLEQIQEKAEELGLKSLGEPPVWLEIDQEKLDELNDGGPDEP